MSRSLACYIRGSTKDFYAWLDKPAAQIPRGPPVWICGDCHVGNFGPIAGPDGNIEIQIRDFDQATIGNPAYDVLRLGLSLSADALASDLSGVTTARMLKRLLAAYAAGLDRRRRKTRKKHNGSKTLRKVLRVAASRSWTELANERIDGVDPTIPLGDRFWPISAEERDEIERLCASEEMKSLVTCLRGRDDGAKLKLLDAAYWVKGCSSLGRLRYAVLLRVGRKSKQQEFCLIDIKEAVPSVAPTQRNASGQPALRVVEAARRLAPAIGERMQPARFLRRPVFIRELRPQDLKPEMPRLSRQEVVRLAEFLAAVLGRAHGEQMDGVARRSWKRKIMPKRNRKGDAAPWLWLNVVHLMAAHERGYLEHCRRVEPKVR